jgi:hypothetical protein
MIQPYPSGYVYPKVLNSFYYQDTYIPMFIAALFRISKVWDQLRYP